MPSRTDRRAGFLLVEVLAAVAVMAGLVAVVLPLAGTLLGRWHAGQASALQADAWMRAVARLSDDTAQALPVRAPQSASPALAFSVAPTTMRLIRPRLAGGGLEQVTYRVTGGGSGEQLVRAARPVGAGDDGAGGSTIVLIEGPVTFRFSAVDRNGARTSAWAEGPAMPLRVDLAVVRGEGGARLPYSPIALPIPARADAAGVTPLLRTIRP